jgi:hypothetical protein
MYDDENWTAVTGEELTGFLDQISPVDGKYKVSPDTTKVGWRPLPFYENVALIRVTDTSWTPNNLKVFFLTKEGNLFRLNGTSPPIHEVNAQAPVKLNDDNILDYLKFFCFFVRGEEGPFLIAEDMDDPDMPQNMDDKTKAVVEGTIRPATFEGMNEQGFYLCDACVFYSNALFIANFAIQPSGMIEMLDDEPIAADLPVKVDAPIA